MTRLHSGVETIHDPKVTDADSLRLLLASYGISTVNWGEGATKTLEHLLREIRDRETEMIEEDGELIRQTTVVGVDVYVKVGDKLFHLKEDRQVFANGSERRRDLVTSFGEKMSPGETVEEATFRGVKEELGIPKDGVAGFEVQDKTVINKPTETYPGLLTRLIIHRSSVTLTPESYTPEGYVEVQPGEKNVYFVWEEVGLPH